MILLVFVLKSWIDITYIATLFFFEMALNLMTWELCVMLFYALYTHAAIIKIKSVKSQMDNLVFMYMIKCMCSCTGDINFYIISISLSHHVYKIKIKFQIMNFDLSPAQNSIYGWIDTYNTISQLLCEYSDIKVQIQNISFSVELSTVHGAWFIWMTVKINVENFMKTSWLVMRMDWPGDVSVCL